MRPFRLFAILAGAVASCTPEPPASPNKAAPSASAPPPPASVSVLEAPPTPPPLPPASEAAAMTGPPAHGRRYAVVVSFISPGNGTDGAAYERLLGIVRDVGAGKTGHVSGRWGKEGEHDECFDLASLSRQEKKTFLERVRLAVAGPRTQIKENDVCRNEPR